MPLLHSVEEITLKNGARGLLVDVPGASVMHYDFSFRAGNEFVRDPRIQQTAHILEHLAFGANETFETSELFSQEFSRNGAYSNASTTEADVSYYGNCADFEWDRILDLQQLAITRPVFLEENVAMEKGNVREELVGQAANHGRLLWQTLGRASGSTRMLDLEKRATIDAVTLADIQEHYARTHVQSNMRFVIAGNVAQRRLDIIAKLESWKLPIGEGRLEPAFTPAHKGELVHIKRADMDNIQFGLTLLVNRQLSVDEESALDALNHILTGTFHSRIFGKARSRGLCYSMGSQTGSDSDGTSEWSFGGAVSRENAVGLFTLLVQQLQDVRAGGITAEEIEGAKLFGLGNYQKSNQTVGALAGSYGSYYFFDGSIQPIPNIPKRIEALDVTVMATLAREFIAASNWSFGAIGDVDKPELAQYEAIIAQLFEG